MLNRARFWAVGTDLSVVCLDVVVDVDEEGDVDAENLECELWCVVRIELRFVRRFVEWRERLEDLVRDFLQDELGAGLFMFLIVGILIEWVFECDVWYKKGVLRVKKYTGEQGIGLSLGEKWKKKKPNEKS